MPMTVVELENVKKIYSMGDAEVHALKGISFKVEQGEFFSIMGPSGSGKSTCMNMIGCLDTPTSGIVKIDGKETSRMTETELAVLRNKTIGFVFQQYHLIPSMTVIENVMLPLKYKRTDRKDRLALAKAALEKVGLSERENHRPNELSGGQKQRVAIARAIIAEPKIILADEPTGALDTNTGIQVMDLFHEINKTGTTIIIVTHDPRIGESTERVIKILDGLLC
ncbi:MAG: ABC transporter ATP-binding protein [Treponema sp.]|nr:ABC transporter ATP-binding protein [Treponema sp.]MDD5812213.1 ABC transporter ATP-binding protein [Treponema sp.]